ncbi:MAG: hypothetical protein GF329_15555 [Candidatus Lokiarchaeota archaeon]|nr:hypothetical protein [Candidatus Lokiarchaeota archaeon]
MEAIKIARRRHQGPGGFCVCPTCGYKTKHVPGKPCNQMTCPKCNTSLIRQGGAVTV